MSGLETALKVASWGWRVVPAFCSKDGRKIAITDWVGRATKDPDSVRALWAEKPWWVGVVSGPGSCLVVDCDGPAAVSRFRAVVEETGWGAGGLVYRTPGKGGGLHAIWTWPSGLPGFQRLVFDGIEIRGMRCFALLCGAPRPDLDGGKYELLEEPGPEGPEEAPRALVDRLMVLGSSSAGSSSSGGDLPISVSFEDIEEHGPYVRGVHERQNTLAGLCWHLAMKGNTYEEILAWGVKFAEEYCEPPLDFSLVDTKAKYVVGRAERYKIKAAAEAERVLGHLRWDN